MFTLGWTTVIIGGAYLIKAQEAGGLAAAVMLASILAVISTFDVFAKQPSELITKLIWRRLYRNS
jgi:Na+/proline symporter